MTTNRLPAIERLHDEQLSAASLRHAEQVRDAEQRHTVHIETLMNNFRSDLKAMWDIKREDDRKLSEALDRLTDILRQNSCKFTAHGHTHADRP